MRRRTFLTLPAAAPLAGAATADLPKYRVVTSYKPAARPGMPGPYPGKVVSLHSEKCIDESTDTVNAQVVREMLDRGICALTGDSQPLDAWKRFFTRSDVVGIKVNCVGRPKVVSSPEVVAEIVRNLTTLGIPPKNIYLYERFQAHLDEVNYAPHLPPGVQIIGAETGRGSTRLYDPATYVEVNFFGEEDTRSNVMKLVSQTLTKIINVPNMKDHGASGVTGCLKNIAYGSYSNVARSHENGKSHTYSFIGTLAAAEPVRSRTVLQIMDGLRGVWHGGPFGAIPGYVFYPKRMLFGTDPVALDRLLLDIIDDKRKAEGAISIWDRSEKYLKAGDGKARDTDPNVNILIREPGHIEYAARLGLGVYDLKKIRVTEIRV